MILRTRKMVQVGRARIVVTSQNDEDLSQESGAGAVNRWEGSGVQNCGTEVAAYSWFAQLVSTCWQDRGRCVLEPCMLAAFWEISMAARLAGLTSAQSVRAHEDNVMINRTSCHTRITKTLGTMAGNKFESVPSNLRE
jgi:hypothetical protein